MPDTKENQALYPQQSGQKPGLGFPICRMVGVICLLSGPILNAAMGPYKGKGGSEHALLWRLHTPFNRGDLVLGDINLMEDVFSPIRSIGLYVKKFIDIFKKYKLEKGGYRYSLIDVTSQDNEIQLHVIVLGIKKHFLKLKTEEVVYDDELLSEFSPCDVRAITYLSFQKYIKQEHYSLVIEKQYINKGETIFTVKDLNTNDLFNIKAKKLYQDYELLINLSKKDMVTAISSAVQEQTFLDIKNMGVS